MSKEFEKTGGSEQETSSEVDASLCPLGLKWRDALSYLKRKASTGIRVWDVREGCFLNMTLNDHGQPVVMCERRSGSQTYRSQELVDSMEASRYFCNPDDFEALPEPEISKEEGLRLATRARIEDQDFDIAMGWNQMVEGLAGGRTVRNRWHSIETSRDSILERVRREMRRFTDRVARSAGNVEINASRINASGSYGSGISNPVSFASDFIFLRKNLKAAGVDVVENPSAIAGNANKLSMVFAGPTGREAVEAMVIKFRDVLASRMPDNNLVRGGADRYLTNHVPRDKKDRDFLLSLYLHSRDWALVLEAPSVW